MLLTASRVGLVHRQHMPVPRGRRTGRGTAQRTRSSRQERGARTGQRCCHGRTLPPRLACALRIDWWGREAVYATGGFAYGQPFTHTPQRYCASARRLSIAGIRHRGYPRLPLQLTDMAGSLDDVPERARAHFRRLGVSFPVSPVFDATTAFPARRGHRCPAGGGSSTADPTSLHPDDTALNRPEAALGRSRSIYPLTN